MMISLRHLKAAEKVCQIAHTRENLKKKLQFRVGGVNIDVTTLQRETYFLKEFLDVWCGLQGFFGRSGFGWILDVGRCIY